MDPANSKSDVFSAIDQLFSAANSCLNNFAPSQVLQDFLFYYIHSFLYSNLILNFFRNLTGVIDRDEISRTKEIDAIKKKYSKILEEVTFTTSDITTEKKINREYYNSFKSNIQSEFPTSYAIISEIERHTSVDEVEAYLELEEKKTRQHGKKNADTHLIIVTRLLEFYVSKEKRFPAEGTDGNKVFATRFREFIEVYVKLIFANLKGNVINRVTEEREYEKGFQARLYELWKEPIDLLKSLINFSIQIGQQIKDEGNKNGNKTNAKYTALIKLHARAILISKEILTLIISGYADGANARWRSLHELAVISFFLNKNDERVAERYLDHSKMKSCKDLEDYQLYCDKIGYEPFTTDEIEAMQKEIHRLVSKYGRKFEYRFGYEWIPDDIIPKPTFRKLEKHLGMDHFRPYYSLSSDSIHGGSKGFHYMGLRKDEAEVLLVGPSHLGLADPLHATAISLEQITVNLLTLNNITDFAKLAEMNIMGRFVKEVGNKALEIHEEIEQQSKDRNII